MESKAADGRRHNFTIIDNEVIKRTAEIGIYALSVYTVLAQMANAQNKCFPGQRHIAETLGISDRQVRRGIDALERAGLLTVSHRIGFPSTYTILPVKKDTPARQSAVPRTISPESLDCQSAPPRTNSPTNKTNIIRQEEQDGHPGEPTGLTIQEQVLVPVFNRVAEALEEPDLKPTSSRLHILRKATNNVHIGGSENIVKAARNLLRSSEVDPHKTYDWLLNKFDYEERITKFLTRKAAGQTNIVPDSAPADWRPL